MNNPFNVKPELGQDEEEHLPKPTLSEPTHDDFDDIDSSNNFSDGATKKDLMKRVQNLLFIFVIIGFTAWLIFSPSPQDEAKERAALKSQRAAEQSTNNSPPTTKALIDHLEKKADEEQTSNDKEAGTDPLKKGTVDRTNGVEYSGRGGYQNVAGSQSPRGGKGGEDSHRDEDLRASPIEVEGLKLVGEQQIAPKSSTEDALEMATRIVRGGGNNPSQSQELLARQVEAMQHASEQQGALQTKSANQKFIDEQSKDKDFQPIFKQPAAGDLMLIEGTIVRANLTSALNSDLPGKVYATVTSDVYDSIYQCHILIPMGSKLIGTYNNEVMVGQSRLLIAMNRLIFPNGESMNLRGSTANDSLGRSGIDADVNNHFFKMFGSSLIVGASSFFLGGRDVTSQSQSNGGQSMTTGSAVGTALNNTISALMERNRRIAPTLTKDNATPFILMIPRDFVVNKKIVKKSPSQSCGQSWWNQ